jgi:probable F420-dependent oxidoreductase
MKVDGLFKGSLRDASAEAQRLESLSYDGMMSFETEHDPFFPLLLAAGETERIDLMTSIAVAFARTPMNLAHIGHDLNSYSGGRLILGLGSQIKPHITRRFSMPWSSPAARMREFILAMQAIWDCWHQGSRLKFEGEFYTHNLMTPAFSPKDVQYGAPRIFLAAVGPLMTTVAAEVADGLILHPFTTEKYLREVSLPAINEGLAQSGRSRTGFEVSYPGFVVTGTSQEEFDANKKTTCERIAFYGSTPAYAPVLELHGWNDLQPELNRLSRLGQWEEMGRLISDEILEAFAVVGEPDEVVDQFIQRFAGLVDRAGGEFLGHDNEHCRTLLEKFAAC